MESELFHETQIKIFVSLLPAFVPAAVIILIGIVGNILTINFFSRSTKPSVPWILIKYLAVLDLHVCFVAIPVLLEMMFNIHHEQSILCKMSHFLGNWTVSSSSFVLLTTAIDRYRKICHPLQGQIQIPHLRYLVIGGISVCLLLSVRHLFTFDTIKVTIATGEGNSTLNGSHCAANCDGNYKYICLTFYVIDFGIISIGSLIIIVLYSKTIYTLFRRRSDMRRLIGAAQTSLRNRKATNFHSTSMSADSAESKQFQMSKTFENSTSSSSTNNSTNTALSTYENNLNVYSIHSKCPSWEDQQKKNANEKDEATIVPSQTRLKTRFSKRGSTNSMGYCSVKQSFEWNITFMMFATTIVFLFCFFPYFVIRVFIRLVLKSGREYNFSPWIQFALKLPYLNSAFNPIVYSIFNVKFRRFISKCCCRHRK